MAPTVSVIVTCFNQSDTLGQTLDSIINQEINFPFEIIIGDDCSTDKSRDIAKNYKNKYPDKIILLFHDTNQGVAVNFVKCVNKASGKYIAICAADDFWHSSNKLAIQVTFLEKNEKCGLVYTDYDKLNVITNKITKNWLKTSEIIIYQGEGLVKLFFEGKVPALTLTVMFRKKIFSENVPANDYIKYNFPIEDWPTWLIISKYSEIGYLPQSTATYRFGHESITNPKHLDKIVNRMNREKIMYKYICEMFPEDITFNENVYDIYINTVLLSFAYKIKDYKLAGIYSERLLVIGSKNLKIMAARNFLFFQLFCFVKKFKSDLFRN